MPKRKADESAEPPRDAPRRARAHVEIDEEVVFGGAGTEPEWFEGYQDTAQGAWEQQAPDMLGDLCCFAFDHRVVCGLAFCLRMVISRTSGKVRRATCAVKDAQRAQEIVDARNEDEEPGEHVCGLCEVRVRPLCR